MVPSICREMCENGRLAGILRMRNPAWIAAGVGAMRLSTCVRPIASGIRRQTGTSIWGSGVRSRYSPEHLFPVFLFPGRPSLVLKS